MLESSSGSTCYHLFLLVPERGDCGFEWMERSGLNGAQPWDLELLCGRKRKGREKEGKKDRVEEEKE